ncbi:MAG TPA: CPBP family glutamic-type intramembrane protease [Solirubrobacterales bacterium]|nr:CPBP family glutamic-type intramembrane protease [Solirubrobacterales bacterium]
MEANLVGGEVAKPKREFPYSNWGPWAAVLAVVAALAVGLFLSVPALIVGSQEGKIEALFPPSYSSGASFDNGDATALAVDPVGNRLFADHEDEVRVFGAFGQEIGAQRIGGLEGSRGVAFDPRRGVLWISEKSQGRLLRYAAAGKGVPRQLATIEAGAVSTPVPIEPERIAVAPATGGVFAIDAANDEVVRLNAAGGYVGRLEAGESPAGSFDFGDDDNDIAVDTAGGAGRGDVFVLSGKGDGTVWAFAPTGRFLWELEPESGDEFAALTVDAKGNLWIAEPDGDLYEYGTAGRGSGAPGRTGRKIEAGSSPAALTFAGSGHLFVARELDGTLSTLGNVISQIGTELGFLLVPMALASMRGAKGLRRILERLGFRAFSPSAFGWMALAFALYLAFTILYSVVITEPKQKDIAESFGPTVLQILLIVIAAPIAEETCFRGMLFAGLREKLPRLGAALICGLIFGALHALTGITAVPPLIVFGFLLALLYERTGSIIPGILLHMINNSIALLGQ